MIHFKSMQNRYNYLTFQFLIPHVWLQNQQTRLLQRRKNQFSASSLSTTKREEEDLNVCPVVDLSRGPKHTQGD